MINMIGYSIFFDFDNAITDIFIYFMYRTNNEEY